MVKPAEDNQNRRIAMLIDGDNAQPSLFGEMIAEAGKYGQVTIRRIYGDWTTTNMKSWKEHLNNHAIQPMQQFRYTTGKNATDSAMIIDAMDILYEGVVNGFCLVSSDSDYTRLATRIREKGFFVMGIGRRTTPRSFVNACDVFVFTENIQPQKEPAARKAAVQLAPKEVTETQPPPDPLPLIKSAIDLSAGEDGYAFLGIVGNRMQQLDPSFDARTYGYKQLSQLIGSYGDEIEIKRVKSGAGPSQIYIRLKEKSTPPPVGYTRHFE
ncbi:MAG: NYN domain-containing protein [Dehalococcoidales bacterium]|nr:NYN domain-containing protein [Dehalococcoidales bacterium]